MKDFDEAIELRPDYPAPYYSRGVTNILTGRYREAVDDFNMYMRFNQRDADAYANRGTAYLHLQDTVAAYEDFGRAIRTNREYPRGYLERGSLYMEQGRYDEALADSIRPYGATRRTYRPTSAGPWPITGSTTCRPHSPISTGYWSSTRPVR